MKRHRGRACKPAGEARATRRWSELKMLAVKIRVRMIDLCGQSKKSVARAPQARVRLCVWLLACRSLPH
ncbi:MAG TPA: hypothetical protein VGC91_12120 [Pyrinomonadaceae bacterium]